MEIYGHKFETSGFVAFCKAMKANNLSRWVFPFGSIIGFHEDTICEGCGKSGIYYGSRLDYGDLYHVFSTAWCPHCEKIESWGPTPFTSSYGIEESGFLGVMRAKLMNNVAYFRWTKPDTPCPLCGGITFKKVRTDIYTTESMDSTWQVCINPNCTWPGNYTTETFPDY